MARALKARLPPKILKWKEKIEILLLHCGAPHLFMWGGRRDKKQFGPGVFWNCKLVLFIYLPVFSGTLPTRLGDGVYDTFMMIDETRCPPCSNTPCNPAEAPLSRRLNVSKGRESFLKSSRGRGRATSCCAGQTSLCHGGLFLLFWGFFFFLFWGGLFQFLKQFKNFCRTQSLGM